MAMTTSQYYDYRELIQDTVSYGTEEALRNIYRRIIAETGDYENLRRLDDMYNRRWRIL